MVDTLYRAMQYIGPRPFHTVSTAFCSPSDPFVANNNLAWRLAEKKILFWCGVIHSFLRACDLLLWFNTRNYSLCFQFLIIPSVIRREPLLLSMNSSSSFYLTAFDNIHLVKILK